MKKLVAVPNLFAALFCGFVGYLQYSHHHYGWAIVEGICVGANLAAAGYGVLAVYENR